MQDESKNMTFVAHQITGASRVVRIWFISSLVLIAVIVGALLTLTYIKLTMIDDLRAYEHNLRSEITLLDQLRSQKKVIDESCSVLTKRIHKVQQCTNPAFNSPYIFLKEVANLTPIGVSLQSFVSTHKVVNITGQAQTMRQLTKFMHALGQSKVFTEPKLVTVQSEKKPVITKVTFEIRLLKGAV